MLKKLNGRGKEYYALWWPNFDIPPKKEKDMKSGLRWAPMLNLFLVWVTYSYLFVFDDQYTTDIIAGRLTFLEIPLLILIIMLFVWWIFILFFTKTKEFYRRHIIMHTIFGMIGWACLPLFFGLIIAAFASTDYYWSTAPWIVYVVQIASGLTAYFFILHRTVDRISKGHYKKNGEGFFSDKSGNFNNKIKIVIALSTIFLAWNPIIYFITRPLVHAFGESNPAFMESIVLPGSVMVMMVAFTGILVNQTIAIYYLRHFPEELKFVDYEIPSPSPFQVIAESLYSKKRNKEPESTFDEDSKPQEEKPNNENQT
jgi:hypothetical protein